MLDVTPICFATGGVGSGFIQSKWIQDSALILEPDQMYKKTSDSDPIVMVQTTYSAEGKKSIHSGTKSDVENQIQQI